MQEKEVLVEDNTISKENLPFPIVYYPGHYGTFIGFGKDYNSNICFCSCAKESIEVYIKYRRLNPLPQYNDLAKSFIISKSDFPLKVVEEQMKYINTDDINIRISFEEKLCHICNRIEPAYLYCARMYGGKFKQNYGWYIKKKAYELGIIPFDQYEFDMIKDTCPQEILELIKLDPVSTFGEALMIKQRDEKKGSEIIAELEIQNRKVWNIIENEIRQLVGKKKIGEAWTNETNLYYYIKSIFKDKKIYRHYRPDFLKGLELDIFIEEIKLGIEYQGLQHFEPVKHWGGEDSFKKLQERDILKQKICNSLGINILYFKYNEDLSQDLVIKKLNHRYDTYMI